MAADNLTMSADIQVKAREVDFTTRFNKNWEHYREIVGALRLIKRAPGTALTSKYAAVTLADTTPGEGEQVTYSKATVKEKPYATLSLERYAKAVTIESINDHGYDAAVEMTDDEFIFELQNKVINSWYAYLRTGTLTETVDTFQMAIAKAIGSVKNKWKKMHKGITNIAGFCNILDLYDYYGAANIHNVENSEGINYVKNFMGFSTLFLLSEDEIPRGTVIATPVENIALYYVEPSAEDFRKSGFEYTTDSETKLIGIAIKANYDTGTTVTHALYGMTLFSEYLDGIAVITFGED